MYIKIIVFYTLLFSIKSALSGININNGSNPRNTHRVHLNDQYNSQNVQVTNRPMVKPSFSRSTNQHEPNIRLQQPNTKGRSQNPSSLLPLPKPLNAIYSNKMIEYAHNSDYKFLITSPRNDQINNIRQTQNNLRQATNQRHGNPEKIKIQPFKHGTNVIIPTTLQPVPRVPVINVSKQHSNFQNYGINHALVRQKPAVHHQNVFSHQGNIHPQRTLQNPRSNIQANHSPQNKRFAVIHDNGYVEYFDDLKMIIRKYPSIRIADNIRKLIPNRNLRIPLARPVTRSSNSFANTKISRPLEQHPKIPNENVPNGMLHTLKSTVPIIKSNILNKSPLLANKSNFNFGTMDTSTFPLKVNNKEPEKLETQPKEIPTKSTSNTQNIENKENNFIKTAKDSQNTIMPISNDVSTSDNKTIPLKNLNPIVNIKRKPPIDVILNSDDNVPHQENKSSNSVITKNKEDSFNVSGKLVKDDKLTKSKEVIYPTVLSDKNDNITVNSTSENKPKIIDNSPSKHVIVDKSRETKSNCTKQNGVKNKLKIQNFDLINQTDKKDVDEDYDEELLSLAKPLMWFSATDTEFWEKLVSVDDSPDFLYIIYVQSQPKIEKDRKTTIHENGTIVEEITETIWEAGDDEPPKITKTITVIPPNAGTDGT